MSSGHLIGHVKDSTYFELPRFLGGKWKIPQLRHGSEPIATIHIGFKPIDDRIEPIELKITKFMVIELVVASCLVVVFVRLAGQLKRDGVAKGAWPTCWRRWSSSFAIRWPGRPSAVTTPIGSCPIC